MRSNVSRLLAVFLLCAFSGAGCGNAVSPGTLANTINTTKKVVGPSPADASSRDLLPDTFRTRRIGDLVGSEAPDEIVEDEVRKTLQIKSAEGAVTTLPMGQYIVDFSVLPKQSDALRRLIVHTYPNPKGESSFVVMAPAENRVLARWTENPPASRGVRGGTWRGQPAVFYMVRDELVIRTVDGGVQSRLTIPGLNSFSDLYVEALANGRTALVLSGDGYTAYHAVVVLEANGTVVYHEQAAEHAFGLSTAGGNAFRVETRSQIWEYTIPG